MDTSASQDTSALVHDFLASVAAPQITDPEISVLAELAYGLDQVVSDFIDHHGMRLDAYTEVEQYVLAALAHDLKDQAGINPDELLDNAQKAYDTHSVLQAISQNWPEFGIDAGENSFFPNISDNADYPG